MKKAANTLAASATALLTLQFMAALISLALYLVMSFEDLSDIPSILYALHYSKVVTVGALAIIGAILCLTMCSHKIGWWSEVICLVAFLLVGSILPYFIDLFLQLNLLDLHFNLGRYYNGFNNSILIISSLSTLAQPLLLMACGISIVYKYTHRKQLKKE